MSKQPTYDLPPASANGTQALLLDANAGNYSVLPNGKGIVHIEKYVIRKPFVNRQEIGTPSSVRPETFLVKETDYTDVGGGWFEFERHYANIPDPWFDFQVISVTTAWVGKLLSADYVVNPLRSGGSQRNFSTLAKVTREYYLEDDIPTNLDLTAPRFIETSGFTTTVTFTNIKLREDDVNLYLGKIYEVARFTGTVTVSNPSLLT